MPPLDLAKAIGPELVALRRQLHQRPELGLELPLTQQAVERLFARAKAKQAATK